MTNSSDIGHRDRVLRAYFEGRNWDYNEEFTLKRDLVRRSSELLPSYPLIFDDEWEVEPNTAQSGKGDLIFTDGLGKFAVVEVKWIDNARSGDTVSTRRTKKRKQVREQAIRYRDVLAGRLPNAVTVAGYYFTNEHRGIRSLRFEGG